MKKLILILVLASLACGATLPQAQKTMASMYAVPQTSDYPITITGEVNIRGLDGVATGHSFEVGSVLWGTCEGDWCYVRGGEFKFWRGCSSEAKGRGCR